MKAHVSYDMPIEAYHGSRNLSHSKLRDFASKGARYFAMRHVSRTTPPPEDTEAQTFGQIFEDIVQGRGFDRDGYAVKPSEGKESNFSTTEGRAWKKAALAAGKRIVSAAELDSMEEMRTALEENESALDMIRACGGKQVTISLDYAPNVTLMARPDWLSADGCAQTGFAPYSLDLKTTINLGKLVRGKSVADYGYHSQAAIVRHLMRAAGHEDTQHYLLACEKKRPYRCQVVEIPEDWLDIGWAWCERQMSKIARHYEQNEWPRVDSEIVTLPAPPSWVADAGDDEEEAA